MTTPETKYAVDLSNDGLSLWHRDESRAWKLLGKVALSSENFSDEIERLKTSHITNSDGIWIAQVRIPNSEVFVSDINLGGAKGDKATLEINTFLARNTPYSADDLVFDLAQKSGADIAYVAAITKETIAEAREFISGYGFEAAYYTTKLDKDAFPRNPRFYDAQRPVSAPSPVADQPAPEPNPKPDGIVVPPPPAPITKPKAEVKAEKTSVTNAKPEEKADLGSFETVRSKHLAAPVKSALKVGAPPLKASPKPQPRISIEIPKFDKAATPKKAAKVIAPIKMPQSTTIQTDVSGIFKPRYILILLAFILLGLLYWFYNALIDGKEEITRLQRISDTPPVILTPPLALEPQASTDNAPQMATPPVVASSQELNLDIIPLVLSTPDPINTLGSTTQLATAQNPETSDGTTVETVLAEEAVVAALDTNAETATTLLVPTKAGTPGPEGITLFLGRPDFLPPQREQLKISQDPLKDILPKMRNKAFEEGIQSIAQPAAQPQIAEEITEEEPVTDQAEVEPVGTEEVETLDLLALADPSLNNKQPKPRPSSIARIANDLKNSLLARADPALASSKPKRRPANLSVPVARIDPVDIEVAIRQVIAETARPRARPRSLSRTVKRAKENVQTASLTPAPASGTSRASSPSPVNIQKEATESSRFNKRQISLVGVSGTSSNRRALVRMPSGRYITVKSGQRFSGWKVAAIGKSTVRITKGNRNKVLRMPK